MTLGVYNAGMEVMPLPHSPQWLKTEQGKTARRQSITVLYLRLLGLVYASAFFSLALQVKGLLGMNGVSPVAPFLDAVRDQIGLAGLWTLPTLAWFSPSNFFLSSLSWAGFFVSFFLVLGVFPWLCCAFLWLTYLSLVNVGDVFFMYQWDSLLLEAGFLALFIAPFFSFKKAKPSAIGIFLQQFLWFRLLFSSGCVKLLSGDVTWQSLTALRFHYVTQPLPTWIAWYLSQLPLGFQKASTFFVLITELAVPFLIFGPRKFRRLAFGLEVTLQLLILATGNYGFFNYLTLALCLWCLNDLDLPKVLRLKPSLEEPITHEPNVGERVGKGMGWAVAAWVGFAAAMELLALFAWQPRWTKSVTEIPQRLHWVSSYGLFAVMTTERNEIQIEGSRDGKTWLPYEFRWKPGELNQRPKFVAPYQPRLDWQAWFASLSDYPHENWLKALLYRLLQNDTEVLALLKNHPFMGEAPKYIRVQSYRYRFTSPAERKASGNWWARKFLGAYSPVLTLEKMESR